ncbi:hypothetical protein SAEN111111_01670 [Saccharibacillus endophyticus]
MKEAGLSLMRLNENKRALYYPKARLFDKSS